MTLTLTIRPDTLAVCKLSPTAPLPDWATSGALYCIARTPTELSIVCAERLVPGGVRCERGFRALSVDGQLKFGLTGILARLTARLSSASVPVFVFSTFDTDYLLVRAEALGLAIEALRAGGMAVSGG
jgi:hypothetical protein